MGVDKMLENLAAAATPNSCRFWKPTGCLPIPRAGCAGWKRTSPCGLSAEAAVEKEQSQARARMSQVTDPYLRERLADLDDLSATGLLRILTGQGKTER